MIALSADRQTSTRGIRSTWQVFMNCHFSKAGGILWAALLADSKSPGLSPGTLAFHLRRPAEPAPARRVDPDYARLVRRATVGQPACQPRTMLSSPGLLDPMVAASLLSFRMRRPELDVTHFADHATLTPI